MPRDLTPIHQPVRTTAPADPPANRRLLYPKADGWYDQTSAGIETRVDKSAVGATGGVNSKVFRHVLVQRHPAGATTGSLVISTPITFPGAAGYMTRIHLAGYNYVSNLSDIDAVVTFYTYISGTTGLPTLGTTSFRSNGNRTMTCRLGHDANNLVVIILDNPEGTWTWTHLHIPFAQMGHTNPPDSFATGWSAAVTTDLTPYTLIATPPVRDTYAEITNLRARTITGTSGLTGGGDLTANRTISANFGTGNSQVARGDHSHTTAPLHKTTHYTGASDALTPADIGAAPSTHTHPDADHVAISATAPFSGTARFIKRGKWVDFRIEVTRASGFDTALTSIGVTVPWPQITGATEYPATPMWNAGGGTNMYQFRIDSTGVVQIRQTAATSLIMVVYGGYPTD